MSERVSDERGTPTSYDLGWKEGHRVATAAARVRIRELQDARETDAARIALSVAEELEQAEARVVALGEALDEIKEKVSNWVDGCPVGEVLPENLERILAGSTDLVAAHDARIRREALEEAAKVAEARNKERAGHPLEDEVASWEAKKIAVAIRNLEPPEKGAR